ncbi:hypothetical protein ACWEQL_35585, partial [Kitasatospora sp. NPDC004240]
MTDHADPRQPTTTPEPATAPAPVTPPVAPAFAPPTDPPAPPAAGPAGVSAVEGSFPEGDVWAAPGSPGAPVPAPETAEERAARLSRLRRTALRWGAAALVFAVAGTGAAVAVTSPERTDIPGLRTESDGRYTFPPLVLPPLPSGKPSPGGPNGLSRHAADLRNLLLPVPKEAGGSLVPASFPAGAPATAPGGTESPTGSPTATTPTAAPAAPTAATPTPGAPA